MDKDLIRKKYKQKIELLIFYNKKYYNDNISEIADSKYDKLKKEIITLEKNYSFLKNKNSPSQIVGHKPSKNFKKVSHKFPMLSLGNAFNEKDLNNFEKKISNYLNQSSKFEIEYSVEP